MESIQDYPSSYEFRTRGNQTSYVIPSIILDSTYISVSIDKIVLASNLFDIYNNMVILRFTPLDNSILKVRVASSIKGVMHLNTESSQEAVLEAMTKMNVIIDSINTIKNVQTIIPTITLVNNSNINISIIASRLLELKNIADNINMFSSIDIKRHSTLSHRDTPDSHSMESITGLVDTLNTIQLAGVFPTSIANEAPTPSTCLTRENGDLKALDVLSLASRRIRLETPVSPYIINNGILNGSPDIYGVNVNRNRGINDIYNKGLAITYPESRMIIPTEYTISSSIPPIIFPLNINTNLGFQPFYGLVRYATNRGFYIDVVKNVNSNNIIISPNIKLVNNTLFGADVRNNDLWYYPHTYKQLLIGNKMYVSLKDTTTNLRSLVKMELTVSNNVEFKMTMDTISSPYPSTISESIYSILTIIDNKFYLRGCYNLFNIYDITTGKLKNIHSSVIYKGITYTLNESTYTINSIDLFNAKYLCYMNKAEKKLIFVDIFTVTTDLSNTLSSVYREEFSLITTAINSLIAAGGALTSDYYGVKDFDLKNNRFLIELPSNPSQRLIYIHNSQVVALDTLDYIGNVAYMLPRDKEGNFFVAYLSAGSYNKYVYLMKNNTRTGVLHLGNDYVNQNTPRCYQSYSGSSIEFFLDTKHMNPNDLHMTYGAPRIPQI